MITKKSIIKFLRYSSVLGSMGLLITVMGFGCGVGFSPLGYYDSSGNFSSTSNAGDNDDLVVVSGKRTVSTAYYEQALANMQSMAEVQELSQQTINIFNSKLGSFSDYGSALSINAPMMQAFTSVGAEVCGDLISQELRMPPRFLASIAPTAAFNESNVPTLVRRFSRAFWQRNETPEELALLQTQVLSALQDSTNNQTNFSFRGSQINRGHFRASLFLCTAMISSTSAVEI